MISLRWEMIVVIGVYDQQITFPGMVFDISNVQDRVVQQRLRRSHPKAGALKMHNIRLKPSHEMLCKTTLVAGSSVNYPEVSPTRPLEIETVIDW